jgi:hypothetical protein
MTFVIEKLNVDNFEMSLNQHVEKYPLRHCDYTDMKSKIVTVLKCMQNSKGTSYYYG